MAIEITGETRQQLIDAEGAIDTLVEAVVFPAFAGIDNSAFEKLREGVRDLQKACERQNIIGNWADGEVEPPNVD